jgi:antitoxin YefM
MSRLHFDQDVQPLSDFIAGATSFIRQINETRRPLVITQRGKSVAVVMGVSEYKAIQEKIELFEEIQKAEVQLSADLGVSNLDARGQILKLIKELR